MPNVYAFDHKHRKAPMEMKDLLGGKGANLAEMTSVLGLPVPAGFTITTDACRAYMHGGWPEGLTGEVERHVRRLEKAMGKKLGDSSDPLLVSVRSGAKFSMPGMMDTVLNLGLNDASVKGLADQTSDDRFAYDSYRRFISMYGRIVLDIPGEEFDQPFEDAKRVTGVATDAEIPAGDLADLCEKYKEVVERATGQPFPQEPSDQLQGAIEAVFRSWNGARARAYRIREKIDHELGTAVNVQAMVFGNRNDNSGTGVGFTRDPATGAQGEYGDFLVNAQGEDVVAGIRNTLPLSALQERFPHVHTELMEIFARLEAHYRDMCDTEFTIEDGRLWMLQTRVGKRTGKAAFKMAVDMTKRQDWKPPRGVKLTIDKPAPKPWQISKEEAISRVSADHADQLLHPQFAVRPSNLLTKALAASPGAAVGKVYFTADEAVAAAERGEAVILVRSETSPEDVHGMIAAQGILTSRGGLVSHAAVVARGWGKPAVVGAEKVRITGRSFSVGDITVAEGDVISLDGGSGEVALGEVALSPAEPTEEFQSVLKWADSVRKGKMAVRANADNGPDAANARRLGAEGIGLCRTEHMFLADDRLPIVRRMILAETPEEEDAALEELREAQKLDFVAILEAMDNLPVTVRLLDPPLHEFLPSIEELELKAATSGLDAEEQKLLGAAKEWREVNPMLGTRGVRLGVIKPGLYAMQVRALMEAAKERLAAGGKPRVEVMIPLTVTREELALARSWVAGAVESETAGLRRKLDVTIGTMIETPRAAVRADEIAEVADFFSFGTNDLTQMTFGFSRDDVEGRMMAAYLEAGLLKRNPFETIDQPGVGQLVLDAVARGRATVPGLKMGVCGEHGGDPESIAFFRRAGLDYVSCSPFRVPIARLAAAQAVLADG
ncbi:pyruvate, phosphate dikinase [Acidiferrimicrobium sp. IK]|uniref:pyruvate, phosphate dikinase n=1 Tax=Acidiferrimicrobium sp. IK TaxID=2871700 RepID=UPI0021CB5BA2|nr:pyruvate, phosphate dikinase [Acidiferrimicrobium sp. IK]MCU4183932.1 pyruvate, phosphate dikinase [Acidiferrimicrobium sp. IK]